MNVSGTSGNFCAESVPLASLIERLEKASGPDEALDAAIVAELRGAIVKPYPPATDFGPSNRWQFWSRDGQHFLANESKWTVPPYTSSIDAALTLVPEGLAGEVSWLPTTATICNRDGTIPHDRYQVEGATIPIALCIAALKARSAA